MVLNEMFNVEINENIYRVKLAENMHGPKRTVVPKEAMRGKYQDESSMCLEEDESAWDEDEMEENDAEGRESFGVSITSNQSKKVVEKWKRLWSFSWRMELRLLSLKIQKNPAKSTPWEKVI